MLCRYRVLNEKPGRCAGVCAMLSVAVILTWASMAGAEILFLPDANGTMRTINTETPGFFAARDARPDDTTASKADGVTFNVYYEDVQLGTGAGFDDAGYGAQRRACVVETLTYIAGLLPYPGRTCDVAFERSDSDGTGTLYEGGAYFSGMYGIAGGHAFKHIVDNHDMNATNSDMLIRMDFGWPWYTGPDSPSASQFDLRSALLQVLTRGLGVVTLAKPDGSSKYAPAVTYSVWDSLLETGTGVRLWAGDPPTFHGTAASLTGADGGVLFVGAKSVEFNEGKPVVYAPSAFDTNNSLGVWNRTSGVVMKPTLLAGEKTREYNVLDLAALYDIGYTNIVLPLTFTLAPRGGWFSVGDSLSMSVRVVGAVGEVSYQWQKDGSDYPGADSSVLAISPLALLHAGNYTCVVTDDTGSYTSPAANVQVFAAGQLPAMGIIGLCLVAVACVLAGALVILRRE